jgi:hypothetical protein
VGVEIGDYPQRLIGQVLCLHDKAYCDQEWSKYTSSLVEKREVLLSVLFQVDLLYVLRRIELTFPFLIFISEFILL